MLHYKIYENNSIFGVFYMFPSVGDCLPMHDHNSGGKHNLIVLKGAVCVTGINNSWEITLSVGDVFDFNDEQHQHEITAIQDNTEILSIAVNGKEPDYKYADGKTGTLLDTDTYEPYEFVQPKRLPQS